MKRLLLALALLGIFPGAVQAADAIVLTSEAGDALYVRIYLTSSTEAHRVMVAGTANATRRFAVTDANLVTAGLPASTAGATVSYTYDVFYGSTASGTADDLAWGSGKLLWLDGVSMLAPPSAVTLDESQIDQIVAGLVDAGAVASPVSPDIIDKSRTWIAEGYRARNIVEIGATTGDVTLALAPALNASTTIQGVTAVTVINQDTAEADLTASDLSVDRSRTMCHFTIANPVVGEYTAAVTVLTVDGQTLTTTGTLKVH